MSREELRSAYNKIALSDEFKTSAKEKLCAAAKKKQSGVFGRTEHYANEPALGADKTIRISDEDKKPRRNIFTVIGVSAAAIAVLALSAVLINMKGTNIVPPVSGTENSGSGISRTDTETVTETVIDNEGEVTEEADTQDMSNVEYCSYLGIGELSAKSGATAPIFYGTAEKTESFSKGIFSEATINALPEGFGVDEEESGVYDIDGESVTVLVCEGRGGRFAISMSENNEAYVPFVDNRTIVPRAKNETCRLISARDYLGANSLNADPVDIRLNYTEINGEVCFGGQWTDDDNKRFYTIQTKNLNFGKDIQDIFAYMFYGLDEMPTCFGKYENKWQSYTDDSTFGCVTFNELATFDDEETAHETVREYGADKALDNMDDYFINVIDSDKLPGGLKPSGARYTSDTQPEFESGIVYFTGDNNTAMTYMEASGDTVLRDKRYGVSCYRMRANDLIDKEHPCAFGNVSSTLYLATNSDRSVYYAEWKPGDHCCYLTCENMDLNGFVEILSGLTGAGTGDIIYCESISAGDIRFQPLKAVPKQDPPPIPDELKQVDAGISRTSDLTSEYQIYESSLKNITDTLMPGYEISFSESVCMVDSLDRTKFACLKYERDDGCEFYLNFMPKELIDHARYVENNDGEIYVPLDENAANSVLSYGARRANNYIDPDFVPLQVGGKVDNGVKYYYAQTPKSDMYIIVSAVGCEPEEFAGLVKLVIGDSVLATGKKRILGTIDTEQGAMVINAGIYMGTGGPFMTHVRSSRAADSENDLYTSDDVLEFTGNPAFLDPPLPFEPYGTEISYAANYVDFKNSEKFYSAQPQDGETADDKFLEAREYFMNGAYSTDKLEYFKNKTPSMRQFGMSFSNPDAEVYLEALAGDFGERYLGNGFECLTPKPSTELCGEYMSEHAAEVESGELTPIYVAVIPYWYRELRDYAYPQPMDETVNYYAGFKKDGLYYTVYSNGVSPEDFAKILTAVYTG